MWNFNFSLCLFSIATFAGAAEISFVGNNKLSGELIAMDQDGMVTLSTPYATEPLKLNPEGIVKINFNKVSAAGETPKQNLTLINGDSFPVDVHSFDDKVLKISSPTLGNLDIPREIISSLNVGKFSSKSIYTGPNNISDWKDAKQEVTLWKGDNNAIFTHSSGTVYRDVKLPDNYSVRFKLSWEESPNFQFSFSDPMDYEAASMNRYFLQFNRAVMSVRRESTGRQRFFQIENIDRKPEEFTNNEVWMEIRVNRKKGSISLYINDQLQGTFEDKNPDLPKGTGISFTANATEKNKLSVSDIEVSEWEDNGAEPRVENRGDTKEDALISKDGERFGGRILSISEADGGMIYRFKSNFQENPIDLPEKDVSTVFFAAKPNAESKEPKGMRLYFQGRGAIQISKCVFTNETIQITHPLLGDLELNRVAVSSIERIKSSSSNTSTSK